MKKKDQEGISIEIHFKKEFLDKKLLKYVVQSAKNNLLYVDHFLCRDYYCSIDLDKQTENNGFINQKFHEKLELYNKYLSEKKYDCIFTLLDKEKKMAWFIENSKLLYTHLGEKEFYRTFRDNLVYVDHHFPFRKKYIEVLNIGDKPKYMMNQDEIKKLNRLPNEFMIYRGICMDPKKESIKESERDIYLGNSWTLNVIVAEFFSCCHAPKFTEPPYISVVLSYKIKKTEIIALFLSRNEFEVFLDHKKIILKNVKINLINKSREKEIKKNPSVIKKDFSKFKY